MTEKRPVILTHGHGGGGGVKLGSQEASHTVEKGLHVFHEQSEVIQFRKKSDIETSLAAGWGMDWMWGGIERKRKAMQL